MNPREIQFEKFWRNQILDEIEQLINDVPEVNAQGIVISMKEKVDALYL
jgi:hypothetical protein